MSVDLRCQYLGFELANPLVVSACPLTRDLERLHQLSDAGAAAAVLPSLFEEQILHAEQQIHWLYEEGVESYAESTSYFPELEDYNTGPESYLDYIRQAKDTVSIPIIASLNGCSLTGWTAFARQIESAGADALELNVYLLPNDPETTSQQIEQQYLDLVVAVREEISIPLAVKLGPYFTAPLHFAKRMEQFGVDGLTLFNRFLHPNIDIETLQIVPQLELSRATEARLPARWIAMLRDHVSLSLAATSGIHTPADVLKLLLVGADVTMMASALYQRGPGHLAKVLQFIAQWMEEHEYTSIEQLRGSMSYHNCPNPAMIERNNYLHTLTKFGPQHMSWNAQG